ncbi:hypothetical protein Dda_1559 [Drechslerella dactyloides]|uniref:Mercuric reductase n=1 Tax=Drechslerella dactyloides TaxID=74499 RepID=A0AAD6J2N7_DREDA|nr:hypothetical protein Dda_1559 [Drechslerella dactyloides]
MSPRHFHSIILGSGQAASPLAQALVAAHGKGSTLLVERVHIGGTCVNEGCTPTKTMVSSGRVAYLAARGQDYGVSNTVAASAGGIRASIDMTQIRQRKRNIVNSFRTGGEGRLEKAGVQVKYGIGRFISPKTVAVKKDGEDEEIFTAENVFINTGCRPADPNLPGVESVDPDRVLDSTSIMELGEVPKRLIVVGAGYVGLEFGHLFRRLGAEVTVVGRGTQVLGREDTDVAEEVLKILRQDGMVVELGVTTVRLESVDQDGMKVKLVYKPTAGGEEKSVLGSHILWSAGRVPNTDMLDVKAGGIEVDSRGFVKVDERLATTAEGVYALGDVKGGPAFTHISYDDYRILNNNLLKPTLPKLSTTDRMVPYTVYIDPQLGHIGLHEHEARKQFPDRNIKVAKMPMTWVARALETDEVRGLMKAVIDGDSGEILGFTCLGIEGGEIMSMVQIAMMGKLKYEALQNATFAHPTLAESLNNLWGTLE